MHEKSFELQKISNIQVQFCILFKPSIKENRVVLQKIHILSCMLNILVDMLNLSILPQEKFVTNCNNIHSSVISELQQPSTFCYTLDAHCEMNRGS